METVMSLVITSPCRLLFMSLVSKTFSSFTYLLYLCLGLYCMALIGCADLTAVMTSNNARPAADNTAIATEVHTVSSRISGLDYKLYVHLPVGYGDETNRRYPVLYTLDGENNFESVVRNYNGVTWYQKAEPMIIVALSYESKRSAYQSIYANEMALLANTQKDDIKGADQYIRVLSQDILPFIDAQYKTDMNDRSLVGDGIGGLMAHYILFNKPELFTGYSIINPTIDVKNSFPFEYEAAYASKHRSLPARVHIALFQHDEHFLSVQKMVDKIQSREYQQLSLKSQIMSREDVLGAISEAQGGAMMYLHPVE